MTKKESLLVSLYHCQFKIQDEISNEEREKVKWLFNNISGGGVYVLLTLCLSVSLNRCQYGRRGTLVLFPMASIILLNFLTSKLTAEKGQRTTDGSLFSNWRDSEPRE